jgi:ATP-dependent DNA ligase
MAKREGIMQASPLELRKLKAWEQQYCYSQPKINGYRCRAQIGPDGIKLLSSSAKTMVSVPHINEALDVGCPQIELDGELYVHGMSFSDIESICSRRVNIHPEHAVMQFHAFDVVNGMSQMDRLNLLNTIFNTMPFNNSIQQVQTRLIMPEEIPLALDEYMKQDYEGIIIRHPLATYELGKVKTIFKLKPRKKDEYRIVGCKEEISKDGDPKGTLGAFICLKDDQVFSVGTGHGLTKKSRQAYWDIRHLFTSGQYKAVIKYQNLTPGRNVPYAPSLIDVQKIEGDLL